MLGVCHRINYEHGTVSFAAAKILDDAQQNQRTTRSVVFYLKGRGLKIVRIRYLGYAEIISKQEVGRHVVCNHWSY